MKSPIRKSLLLFMCRDRRTNTSPPRNCWERNFPREHSEISSNPLCYMTHDVHTRDTHYQWVSMSFLTIASLILWWSASRLSRCLVQPNQPNQDNKLSREFLRLSFLPSFVGSSPRLMWCSRNYSHKASTHRGDAGVLIRGWRRRTRCLPTQPPRQPAEALVAAVPAAVPTSARSLSVARTLSWLGNRCRPRKPWRDLPRARRSSRPGRRRTTRDYL